MIERDQIWRTLNDRELGALSFALTFCPRNNPIAALIGAEMNALRKGVNAEIVRRGRKIMAADDLRFEGEEQ